MGGRAWIAAIGIACISTSGCEEAKEPPARIEVASAHRSCEEGEACGVVETSCTSRGCECGVAVHEDFVLRYQQELAQCRGQRELESCDFECATPFGKCFEGACVLTDEPPDLFRRGRSVERLCEKTRGTYVGCPQCPPNERCASCRPCECPSSHRWTTRGCKAVVHTEARDIRVEVRPPRVTLDDAIKARVTNESKRKISVKTVCGSPFYRARKKEDEWETQYEPTKSEGCRIGAVEIAPGATRHFVVQSLSELKSASGASLLPGTYRFELSYTDRGDDFRYYATVYSEQLELVAALSRR